MSENRIKEQVERGARIIAAAHHMTLEATDLYVERCLASYNRGWKDADELQRQEAALIGGIGGKKDRNEEEAIALTHEFYDWARKQKIQGPGMHTPYVVIIWMLDRILAKED